MTTAHNEDLAQRMPQDTSNTNQLIYDVNQFASSTETIAVICIILTATMIVLILVPLLFSYFARKYFFEKIAAKQEMAWTKQRGVDHYEIEGLTIYRPDHGRPRIFVGTVELSPVMIFYIVPPREFEKDEKVQGWRKMLTKMLRKSQVQIIKNFVYMYGYGEEVLELRGWVDRDYSDDSISLTYSLSNQLSSPSAGFGSRDNVRSHLGP